MSELPLSTRIRNGEVKAVKRYWYGKEQGFELIITAFDRDSGKLVVVYSTGEDRPVWVRPVEAFDEVITEGGAEVLRWVADE